MTKDQNSKSKAGAADTPQGSRLSHLDEIARAAELESGDAEKAWRLLMPSIRGAPVPTWVKEYFEKAYSAVEAFDATSDNPVKIAAKLGFWNEKPKKLGAGYDDDHIADWFAARMEENRMAKRKQSISSLAEEYWDVVQKQRGQPGGVRKAYERARNRDIVGIAEDIELFRRIVASRGNVR